MTIRLNLKFVIIFFILPIFIIPLINSDLSNECWNLESMSGPLSLNGCELFLDVHDIHPKSATYTTKFSSFLKDGSTITSSRQEGCYSYPCEGKALGLVIGCLDGTYMVARGDVSYVSSSVDFRIIPDSPSSYPEAKLIISEISFLGSQLDTTSPHGFQFSIEPSSGSYSTINAPPLVLSSEPDACYPLDTDGGALAVHRNTLHWVTKPSGCVILQERLISPVSISPGAPFSVDFKLYQDTQAFIESFTSVEDLEPYKCNDDTIHCAEWGYYGGYVNVDGAPRFHGYFEAKNMFIRYNPEDGEVITNKDCDIPVNRGVRRISASVDTPGSSYIEIAAITNKGTIGPYKFTSSTQSFELPSVWESSNPDYEKRIKEVQYKIKFVSESSDEAPKLLGKPQLDFVGPDNDLSIEKVEIVQSIESNNYLTYSYMSSIVKDKVNMIFVKVKATKTPVTVSVNVNFGPYSGVKTKIVGGDSDYDDLQKRRCEDAFVFYFGSIDEEGDYRLIVKIDESDITPETNELNN